MNYFIQLTFVRFGAFNTDILSITDPHSMMMTIEVLGYFFMGLSTLFIAPLFRLGRLEQSIRWLFVFNGFDKGTHKELCIQISKPRKEPK
jgi:hypothetical protein